MIEAYPRDLHVGMFHDLVYHHHGDALSIECSSLEQLHDARVSLLVAEMACVDGLEIGAADFESYVDEVCPSARSGLECSKAVKVKEVLIKTPEGQYTQTVPSNKKEHAADPFKEHWDVSHNKAHMTVVSDPRNKMVTVEYAKSVGGIIAPTVMEDKLKTCPSTGYLLDYKSRLCYAQPRVDRIMIARGEVPVHQVYNSNSDDLSIKLAIADGVVDADDVTAADLKDGYWNANRIYTEYAFMDTYEPMFDEQGRRLCYMLGAPQNGERTAGTCQGGPEECS